MSLCHSLSWLLWCSRKYPYPSHGRFFGLTFSPQSLWKFQFLFLLSFQIILITSLDFTSDLGVTSNIRSLFICKKSVKTKMLIHLFCIIVGWPGARWAWDWHNLPQSLGKASWRPSVPASCLRCNRREGGKDGGVCTGVASVPVSLGHGYEHGVQQTGREHGEVDGSSQRHQVRADWLNIYCSLCL